MAAFLALFGLMEDESPKIFILFLTNSRVKDACGSLFLSRLLPTSCWGEEFRSSDLGSAVNEESEEVTAFGIASLVEK